ncbi:hypothetical protein J31TS4_12080 [Paenibacillus sp. J31TS4]|uniref:hypothetical protein n=1 Tax=Paenibacillus sp. J31TS4 TaxID=2807195 RepID=UPI001B075A1F|nr:hypothetical protein [Paenibacillus sp. J31TS4]GIP37928.1 hypothetical protein J31TS4_12080 [Paenibacillus sp. J31TS4]
MTTKPLTRKPPQTTEQETELVKEAVLLPVLLAMVQRDVNRLQEQSLKLSLPNVVVLQRMLEAVHEDLLLVKRKLKMSGIRIFSEVKDANGIRCGYLCRENRGTFTMSRSMVKAEVSILAGKYVGTRTVS